MRGGGNMKGPNPVGKNAPLDRELFERGELIRTISWEWA